MKCADPVLCYTDVKGKRHFRHLSLATGVFIKHLHNQVFNCGKCIFCRKKRSLELAARCVLHASLYKNNCFLTLTYDETKEGYHNRFEYSDIQKFKKRLRSYVSRKYRKNIEVFNVHEYGKNGKKHWHLIVFNFNFEDREFFTSRNQIPYYISETLSKLWKHGLHTIGDVNEASAMYQAQYTQKDFKNGNVTNEKKSHSKHSGLGKPYFLKHFKQILTLGYVPFNGRKMPVPRYYQRLAHKHWSHFNEPSNFYDTVSRKRLYTPFKIGEENKEIADLYEHYKNMKQEKVKELEIEWNELITQYTSKYEFDFQKSESNVLYDLSNKNKLERF